MASALWKLRLSTTFDFSHDVVAGAPSLLHLCRMPVHMACQICTSCQHPSKELILFDECPLPTWSKLCQPGFGSSSG